MNYTCLLFAKHEGNGKPYLFCVDNGIMDIMDGQKILVETCRGNQEAYAVGNSFVLDERGTQSIVSGVGAYLPLKRVIGIFREKTVIKEELELIH